MRKQDERENRIQGKAQLRQKAARKRTRTAAVCIFFLIPLTIARGSLGRKPLVSACQPAGVGGDHGALFPDL